MFCSGYISLLWMSTPGLVFSHPGLKQIFILNWNGYLDQYTWYRNSLFNLQKYSRFLWSVTMLMETSVPLR